MDPRNTHEKTILTHQVPMRENFRSTNTHPQENFRPHQIPTRKNFGPTKYPRENILDPRNTHEKKLWAQEIPTKARWHDSTKSTRPTMAHFGTQLKFSTLLKTSIFLPHLFCNVKLN